MLNGDIICSGNVSNAVSPANYQNWLSLLGNPDIPRERLMVYGKIMASFTNLIIDSTDENVFLERFCNILVQEGGYLCAWMAHTTENGKGMLRLMARNGTGCGCSCDIPFDVARNTEKDRILGDAVEAAEPVFMENTTICPISESPELHPCNEPYSLVVLPLESLNEHMGPIFLSTYNRSILDRYEKEFLRNLSSDISFGLTSISMRNRNRIENEHFKDFSFLVSRKIGDELYDHVVQKLCEVFGADVGGIAIIENNGSLTFPSYYYSGNKIRGVFRPSICEPIKSLLNEEFKILVPKEIEQCRGCELYPERGIGTFIGGPIKNESGKDMGILFIGAHEQKEFSKWQWEILRMATNRVSMEMIRKQRQREFDWEFSTNSAIAEISNTLISPDATIGDISKIILYSAKIITESERGYISVLDEESGDLIFKGLEEDMCHEEKIREFLIERLDNGRYPASLGDSLNSKKGCFMNELAHCKSSADIPGFMGEVENFLAVPSVIYEELLGYIMVANNPGGYNNKDLTFVNRLANLFGLAILKDRMEKSLQSTLEEREILLHEIQHRVKNNLQMMSSLISMKSMREGNDDTKKALYEINNMIKAIAMVHSSAYSSERSGTIRLDMILYNLANNLIQLDFNQKLEATYDLDEVIVDIDTANAISLICNEILFNSLKYAFPEIAPEGTRIITLMMKRDTPRNRSNNSMTGDDSILLILKDNGIGFPERVESGDNLGLGLKIVTRLAQQIGAKIRFYNDGGACVEIILKRM